MSSRVLVTDTLLNDLKNPRLDTVLARATSESRSFLQAQIRRGNVQVNQTTIRKPHHPLRVGDEILAEWQAVPEKQAIEPVAGDLSILYEDADLLLINKPQGLVVHPAPSHQGPTLVHHLLHHWGNQNEWDQDTLRPGIVHRLDKGTSGVLLIAKNRSTQEALSRQFKDRQVKKVYEALVWGRTAEQGRFESTLGRDRSNRLKMSSRTRHGRQAVTEWKRRRVFRYFSLLQLFPFTGRTHQIRVHLSEAGHPIVGDPLYGRGLTPARRKALPPEFVSIVEALSVTLLHAASLTFFHPRTQKPLTVSAPLPALFEQTLKQLEVFGL